jgi:hypothetical protein
MGELLRQTRPEPPAGRASAKPFDFSGDGFDHEEPHGFAGGELAASKRRRAHDARRRRGRPTLLAVGMMLVASHFADRFGHRKGLAVPGGRRGRLWRLLSARVSSFWPTFFLLVIAAGAMCAPYGPFFAWISDRLPPAPPAGRSP